MIIGHNQNIEWLNAMYENDAFPSTLLFVGEKGIGKLNVALCCAKWLENGGSLMDVAKEDISDFESMNKFYLSNPQISEVRELRKQIATTSMNKKKRTIIINNAELLSREVANSLLKTLEEPNPNVFFILIATNENRVISTIRSRSTIFHFYPISTERIKKHLDTKDIEDISLWWDKKPAIAQDLLSNSEKQAEVRNLLQDTKMFLNGDLNVAFRLLEKHKGDDLKDFFYVIVLSIRKDGITPENYDLLKNCVRIFNKIDSNINLLLTLRCMALQRV